MTMTDCPRSFSKASRLYPLWCSPTSNKSRSACGLRTALSDVRENRHSFNCYSRRSFNHQTLLLLISLILFISGALARPAETAVTTSAGGSKTASAPSPTPTDLGIVEQDDGGLHGLDPESWPKAFDTSIGKNFSSTTCPQFFSVFLNDPQFQACLPVSAMLKNSKSFFDIIRKSGFKSALLLDSACSVDFAKCSARIDSYAKQITLPQNCGQELSQANPLVNEALSALLAYPSVHDATCLKAEDGTYCYVDAVTNVTNPDDSHIYYLPLGLQLPGGSRPACTKCTKKTMEEYAHFAGNKTLPLSRTYLQAAEQINILCGPQFANTTVVVSASGPRIGHSIPLTVFAITIAISTLLFL